MIEDFVKFLNKLGFPEKEDSYFEEARDYPNKEEQKKLKFGTWYRKNYLGGFKYEYENWLDWNKDEPMGQGGHVDYF